MLTKTSCPLVIVECGYLSNNNESQLLINDEYQERMAWGIHLAILRYLNGEGFQGLAERSWLPIQ
jgi:N-acetylmuramoyl-L-alanine amidase